MILAAIQHLAGQLSQSLRRTYGLAEDVVVVSGLVEPDGSVNATAQSRVAVFSCGVEKESMARSISGTGGYSDGRLAVSGTPLHLNLRLMVAANFSGNSYGEGLRFLSAAVGFFQKNPVFDRTNSPELPAQIQKLVVEMEDLSLQEESNLWSMLGAKYVPSVLYKVRMVTLDGNSLVAQLPAISQPEPSVGAGFR